MLKEFNLKILIPKLLNDDNYFFLNSNEDMKVNI